jgi:hypothetical protein
MAMSDCQGVRVKLVKLKTGVILEAAFLGRIDFTAKIAVNNTGWTLMHQIRKSSAVFKGIPKNALLHTHPPLSHAQRVSSTLQESELPV